MKSQTAFHFQLKPAHLVHHDRAALVQIVSGALEVFYPIAIWFTLLVMFSKWHSFI